MNKIIAGLALLVLVFTACEKIERKKEFWPNGKVKEEYEVTYDEYGQPLKNGLYKQWYESGQIRHEINFLDDKKHGLQRSYFQNGKIELEENYLFGKLSGKKKTWNIDGKLELEVDYVDGKTHGLFVRYWPNGSKHHEIAYVNGLKDGPHKVYSATGTVESITKFSKGIALDTNTAIVDSTHHEENPNSEMK